MTEVGEQDYLYIRCLECEPHDNPPSLAKVAKNKGADNWSVREEQIREFLLMHGGCNLKNIKLEWVRE
jgi:hypothetical protein